ncbi:MAG: hypothetical protein Q7S21_01290 [archaeon]|nr:hypothetical protein [archaeon]
MKKLILIILAILLNLNIAFSAPGPWGIAINKGTQQCTAYWPGDEFVSYELPTGWSGYFPDQYVEFKTNKGKVCFVERYGEDSWNNCCNQLQINNLKFKVENKVLVDRTEKAEICNYDNGSHILQPDSLRNVCKSITTEDVQRIETCNYTEKSLVISEDEATGCYVEYETSFVDVKLIRKKENNVINSLSIGRTPKPGECPNIPNQTDNNITFERVAYGLDPLLYDSYQFKPHQFIIVDIAPTIYDSNFCEFESGDTEKCCNQLGYAFLAEDITQKKQNPFTQQQSIFEIGTIIITAIIIISILVGLFYLIKKSKKTA